jgi:Type VI secretion system effector, Hcp
MKAVTALILLAFALSVAPLFGSPVVGYIKIDGVQGSSKNPAHAGWIELQSFAWDMPNASVAHKCTSSNLASFIAYSGAPGSGEARLAQMCRAHMPIPQMTVDILGGERHVLQDVQFTTCHGVGGEAAPTGDFEAIRYNHCATHYTVPRPK